MSKTKVAEQLDKLIFPTLEEKIVLVESVDSSDEILTGQRIESSSSLSREILKDLAFPFHQTVLRLNQYTRNYTGNREGPNVLFLSSTEGGFPRKGLRLLGKNGEVTGHFPALNFVDLVLEEDSVKDGALHIFSHELGHVMMNNIIPSFARVPEERTCSIQHVSMGVTDYFTAFFEGWGNHFQYFAHSIEKYRKSLETHYQPQHIFKTLWHCTIDRELRQSGVLRNAYIYEKPLFPELYSQEISLADKILLEHTYPQFNPLKLRNAQQMLSCEGVIAAIFQRIMTSKLIQHNYQNPAFYNSYFLEPLTGSSKALITPYENVMLKNFHVWAQLENSGNYLHSPVFIEYLLEWCRAFPEDCRELISIFINMTAGITLSSATPLLYEKAAFYGIKGDMGNFVAALKEYVFEIDRLTDAACDDPAILAQNIGPELWLENKHFRIRKYLWLPEPLTTLRLNINTASPVEFSTLPGMDMPQALQVYEKRRERGYFQSLVEAKKCGLILP